jgi:predicted XRE-type DNA-binding protein
MNYYKGLKGLKVMATATKLGRRGKPELIASQQFAQVFQAYLECSDAVQSSIRELVEIVNDSDATREEVDAALSTIAEALFPSCHNGMLGVDLESAERIDKEGESEAASVLQAMDVEEASFADRVAALLDARNMTQGDLGAALGIGQSAISMMLSRECRPQRRTVEKIAAVFDMSPNELFPDFES